MHNTLISIQARIHAAAIIQNKQQAGHVILLLLAAIALLLAAADASAATAMPWEKPLCAVANSMKTTVARAAAVIAIVIAGLAMAFGELNGIFKTIMGLIAGASMALLSTSWLSFLGGGAAICA